MGIGSPSPLKHLYDWSLAESEPEVRGKLNGPDGCV